MGSVSDNRRRVRELEAIARVASSFTFAQPLEAMMDEVSRQIVQASGTALACIVGLADRSTRLLTRVAGSHALPEGFQETLERAWRTSGTPLVSSSLQTRSTQVVDLGTVLQRAGYEAVREAQQLAGWATMAVVPAVYRGEAVGLLIIPYPAGKSPDGAEVSFLEAVSDQAAVAIENARLFEQAQAAAVMEERQRISRELHDSVSQALYGIALGAQTAREVVESDPASSLEPLDYVLSLADAALAEMRAMIFELRPEALAAEGLVAALGRQATVLRARHNIAVEAAFSGEPDVSIDAKQMLYRVAQEALQNVAKHSQATQVRLSLFEDEGSLVLQIQDNGRGFVVADSYPGHLGVTSMRERARREGATVSIDSTPGEGSSVRVDLPLD